MPSARRWNILNIVICLWFAYRLCVAQSLGAFHRNADNSSIVDESYEQSNIWSDILEELTIK